MDKRKKHEELVEEYSQRNEQMNKQMLMKLVKKLVFEGSHCESSQTKTTTTKFTDKNNIEAYLTTFEHLMEVYKLYKSHWFFHLATQLTE